ncbi:MAG: hypothetical protein M1831_004919 [Alyxoria varia]|nr:MAG: hypothetical protein M1831_004919 [Alyxoria varia]
MDWCIHNPDCSVEVLLFNGVAGCALALGLFGQAIFATWILIAHRKQILTWSSNPLNNAMAIATNDRSNGKTTPTGFRSRRTSAGKLCDTTTGHKSNKIKAQEGLKRPGIAPSYGFSKVIVIILWVSLFVTLVWTVGIILGVHAQTFDYCKHELERVGGPCVKEPRFMKVPSILMDERENPYDTFREASTEFEGLSFSVLGADYSHPSALYHTMTFLFTTAMQSYLTFALHCAELLINLRRDEKTWRQASSRRGTTSTTNSVSAAFASWETIGLFAFKTVIHWLFGRCVISEAESKFKGGPLEFRMMTNVRMGLGAFALVYLSAVTLSLAGFCTALAYYKPKGLQPSTHGHYQSLIELMGQCRMFQKRIFWDEGMSQADEYTRCSSDGSVEQDKQPATGAKRPARTDTGGSFLRSNMAPAVLAGTSNM